VPPRLAGAQAHAPFEYAWLRRLVVTDELDDGAEKENIQNGWAWYAGI
jgi:hypothetical protein